MSSVAVSKTKRPRLPDWFRLQLPIGGNKMFISFPIVTCWFHLVFVLGRNKEVQLDLIS